MKSDFSNYVIAPVNYSHTLTQIHEPKVAHSPCHYSSYLILRPETQTPLPPNHRNDATITIGRRSPQTQKPTSVPDFTGLSPRRLYLRSSPSLHAAFLCPSLSQHSRGYLLALRIGESASAEAAAATATLWGIQSV